MLNHPLNRLAVYHPPYQLVSIQREALEVWGERRRRRREGGGESGGREREEGEALEVWGGGEREEREALEVWGGGERGTNVIAFIVQV